MADPVSEPEMLRLISEFNKMNDVGTPVVVSLLIPNSNSGIVRLLENESKAEISSFPIRRVRFCARGQAATADGECFALSFTQPNANQTPSSSTSSVTHQCHIFRGQFSEVAGKA